MNFKREWMTKTDLPSTSRYSQTHVLVLPGVNGFADQMVVPVDGGYGLFRRGEDDMVDFATTQRECRAKAIAAAQVDLAA